MMVTIFAEFLPEAQLEFITKSSQIELEMKITQYYNKFQPCMLDVIMTQFLFE